MTIYVTSALGEEAQLYFNIPNIEDALYDFEITSQWSHQPVLISNALLSTNDRYTHFQVLFPAGFSDEHKNGIYNWRLLKQGELIEAGLAKIITEPGGSTGMIDYTSTPETEERVADVYYRPNY